MAGGVGSRFWPYSKQALPKQFHDVLGYGKTMFQDTVQRFKNIAPLQNIFVVTNKNYYQLVKKNIPELSDEQILLEPIGKNTAPCIAYACYKIAKVNPAANVVVTPSDAAIMQPSVYEGQILKAIQFASDKDVLVTLGINPTRPDTGYGYIKFDIRDKSPIKKVLKFTEKPTLEVAQKFIQSGDYVWNAGIFVWNVSAFIEAFELHMPALHHSFNDAKEYYFTPNEHTYITNIFNHCESISIDYALMEKAENVYVIPSDFGWSDVGTWKSVYELSAKDAQGNAVSGNVKTYNTTNCIIKTSNKTLTVVNGIDNCIIVEADGVLMICNANDEQYIKKIVDDIKNIENGKYI
ncbi:MAG: mannose-1-phosphate guanylyltransferase [Cytophagales bacterium]|nr:mannose-1-phosphate guanylyltransferase [Cytophagales bacterium]